MVISNKKNSFLIDFDGVIQGGIEKDASYRKVYI